MAKYKFEKYSLKWNREKWTAQELHQPFTSIRKVNFDGSLEVAEVRFLTPGDVVIPEGGVSNFNFGIGINIYYFTKRTPFPDDKPYYVAVNRRKNQLPELITHDALIETIVAEEGTYPDNGIQDGFWYVRGDRIFPKLKFKAADGQILSIGGAVYKDSSGVIRNISKVFYKDANGIVKAIK